ncbi:MAG: DUF4961 domain-containing protein [Bacteroidetes bacterium]|nr:DUF4961 domain-containing protein [Bacteroidota bacterium]
MNPVKRPTSFSLLSLLSLLAGCITIDRVDQPSTARAGQTITITVQLEIRQSKDNPADRIYFGFLVPRDWNASANTTVTFSSDRGGGKMTLVPPGTTAMKGNSEWPALLQGRFGIGANLVKDMEWVTFQTNATYPAINGGPPVKATIKLVTRTGTKNEIVRLGYYATAEDAIDPVDHPFYSQDLTIVDGKGQLLAFSHPQTAAITPVNCIDNDYLTMTFDGNARLTPLASAPVLYLQATAYTSDHQLIKVTEHNRATRLAPIGNNKWRIQIWPRSFFHLKEDQSLSKMDYYFTNPAGEKVGYDPSGTPFQFEFSGQ